MVDQAFNFLTRVWTQILQIGHDDWLAIFTGLLALFTLLLAVFTGRLWSTTKNYTRILQRAYIAVEPGGIHVMENGSDLIGHVGIKNAGKLPARNVSWFVGIKHSGNGEEPADFFPLEPADFFPLKPGTGSIVIAPDTTATQGSAPGPGVQVETLNEFCGASSGTARAKERPTFLYVWGVVNYDDGFKNGQMTKFCHRYNWINRGRDHPIGYGIDAEFARHHEYGNDAT